MNNNYVRIKLNKTLTAIQWNGNNEKEVSRFVGQVAQSNNKKELRIMLFGYGPAVIHLDQWIVCGHEGRFFPVWDDTFYKEYEVID